MGKRVFLSVLGTGFYNKCVYSHEASDFRSAPTRYIQEATIDFLNVVGWSERDVVYIFTTPKAKANNWDKSIRQRKRFPAAEAEDYVGLQQVLEDKHLKARVKGVDISNGMDEAEMWQVFSVIYGKLEQGDQLYIDLTHGFRYLPMLMLVLCQYAHLLKKVVVKSMTYGNFEAMNAAGEAPLMDLAPLSTLQSLTIGAGSFKEFGKMTNLSTVMGKIGGAKKAKAIFSQIYEAAKGIDVELSTCRGAALQQADSFSALANAIAEAQEQKLPAPVMELLDLFAKQVHGFGTDGVNNLCAAVEWCIKYGMTQQGYTLCKETVVTCLCDHFRQLNPWKDGGKDAAENERKYRDLVSGTIGLSDKSAKDENTWKYDLPNHKPLVRLILSNPFVQELRGPYAVLTHYRNQVNHAGFIAPVKGADLQSNLKKNASLCMDALRRLQAETDSLPTSDQLSCYTDEASTAGQRAATSALLNLSNHPYTCWNEAQKLAAAEYGECVDVPFPDVDPELSAKEIDHLAEVYKQRIVAYADQYHPLTVHVMGEMTFCFALVRRLKTKGIHCIASCAKRDVEEMGDERIKSVYRFIRFRDYE